MTDKNIRNLLGEKIPDYLNIKSIVGLILRENPKTRESDTLLIEKVMDYCKRYNITVPSYETITRARRKFNEVGLYLPSKETQEKRKENQLFFYNSAKKKLL